MFLLLLGSYFFVHPSSRFLSKKITTSDKSVLGIASDANAQGADTSIDPEAVQDKANVDSFIKLFSQPLINLGDPNADPTDQNPSGSTTVSPVPSVSGSPVISNCEKITDQASCTSSPDRCSWSSGGAAQAGCHDALNVCAPGSTDHGLADGWLNGQLHPIKICFVPLIGEVNSDISRQMVQMSNDLRAGGIPFNSYGSFRSCQQQIDVYHGNCKSLPIPSSCPAPSAPTCPTAAKPGYSNHQMGHALDISCAGHLIAGHVAGPAGYEIAKNDQCFQWLVAHAGNYGLFEYGKAHRTSSSYEAWHWSIDGN